VTARHYPLLLFLWPGLFIGLPSAVMNPSNADRWDTSAVNGVHAKQIVRAPSRVPSTPYDVLSCSSLPDPGPIHRIHGLGGLLTDRFMHTWTLATSIELAHVSIRSQQPSRTAPPGWRAHRA
jgi:hypothetical protein